MTYHYKNTLRWHFVTLISLMSFLPKQAVYKTAPFYLNYSIQRFQIYSQPPRKYSSDLEEVYIYS